MGATSFQELSSIELTNAGIWILENLAQLRLCLAILRQNGAGKHAKRFEAAIGEKCLACAIGACGSLGGKATTSIWKTKNTLRPRG